MKQHLLRLAAFIGALLTSTLLLAQNAQTAGAKPESMIQVASSISTAANDMAVLEALNESNQKLYKTVSKKFANATDINIYPYKKQTVMYCKLDGIQNNILLNNKGSWLHTIRYYNASLLPGEVIKTVAEAFPSYNLTNVSEVSTNDGTAYLVNIETKYLLKTIRVVNGLWDIHQEFVKN